MSRRDIHYWKCDRPAAFHGTARATVPDEMLECRLHDAVRERLGCRELRLAPAPGPGHHLTWNAEADGRALFVRLEDGPEGDDYLEMESAVMGRVRAAGVPVPEVLAVDASRTRVPAAWQVMERIPFPDLNHWHKRGMLDASSVAPAIGAAVARWQTVEVRGFGPFDLVRWRAGEGLVGFHGSYGDYFRLHLGRHLGFLAERQFLSRDPIREIEAAIEEHAPLLDLKQGVLVHKDLALWNVLGGADHIAAFIDFDDAIAGDPMDDLSLLACFHDAAFVARAVEGYASAAGLPRDHQRRFWLHLLRNMIVKAVIRVGAGYFERDDGFYLIGSGSGGADLRRFTLERLERALRGLRGNDAIDAL